MAEVDSAEKRRARWRRNKRAARERAKPSPSVVAPDYVAKVLAERDKRALIAWRMWHSAYTLELGRDVGRGAGAFAADVWAAKTLIEFEHGAGSAKPRRIMKWLADNECTHGYKDSSLRVMIYSAFKTIAKLELEREGKAYWARFDPEG